MTPMEAIQCGTINAAELMDVKDTHGSITPGKRRTSLSLKRARWRISTLFWTAP